MNATASTRPRRFPIQLPVQVKVGDGRLQQEVQSRNISSRGIYFEFAAAVDVGSRVEFILSLPERVTKGKAIQVHCFGKVVRVERGRGSEVGIAATIERYLFVDKTPAQHTKH